MAIATHASDFALPLRNWLSIGVVSSMSCQEEPSAKKQKTYNADGPVEDDKTAREKLREAGFDPDDVHKALSDSERTSVVLGGWCPHNITPMTHFALHGDLPMCRYLHHVRGASTLAPSDEQKTTEGDFWFPMYAAVSRVHLDVAKWLFNNGAKADVGRLNTMGSPFGGCFTRDHIYTFSRRGKIKGDLLMKTDLAKWFILNGAMELGGRSDRSVAVACFTGLRKPSYEWPGRDGVKAFLLDWCDDVLRRDAAFHTFLLGTLPIPEYSVDALKYFCSKKVGSDECASYLIDGAISIGKGQAVWDDLVRKPALNSCLASLPGVTERIASYVGAGMTKKKLERVRQFREILPTIMVRDICRPPRIDHNDSDYDY